MSTASEIRLSMGELVTKTDYIKAFLDACTRCDRARAELRSISDLVEPVNEPVELLQKVRNLLAELEEWKKAHRVIKEVAEADQAAKLTLRKENAMLAKALEDVVRIADRKTDIFDAAHAVLDARARRLG